MNNNNYHNYQYVVYFIKNGVQLNIPKPMSFKQTMDWVDKLFKWPGYTRILRLFHNGSLTEEMFDLRSTYFIGVNSEATELYIRRIRKGQKIDELK